MIRLASLLLVCVGFLSSVSFAADPAPTPGGRTIAAWVADLDSESAETRGKALHQLSGQKAHMKSALPTIARLTTDQDRGVSMAAIRLLGEFGPEARDHLPALKKLAQAEEPRSVRARDLAPTMLALTGGTDKEVLRFTLTLEGLKISTSSLLSGALFSPYALGMAGPMTELLADKDPIVRARAADVLGCYAALPSEESRTTFLVQAGEAGTKIAPALDALLSDPDPSVRGAAAVSLAAIKPESVGRFLPVLLALLEARQIRDRVAGQALRPFGAQATAPLIELLPDAKEDFRGELATILAEFGPEARPALFGALKHSNPGVRMGVAHALKRQGTYAAYMLRRMEAYTAPALGDLVAALGDTHPGVRLEVAEAIAAIDSQRAQPTVGILIGLLSESKADHRQRAAAGLGALGPLAKEAVPALVKALGDDSKPVQLSAAHALVEIDRAAASPAVGVLIELGLAKDARRPDKAATALGRIGPAAKDALPKLRDSLRSGRTSFQVEAAVAITRIEPSSAAEGVAVLLALITEGRDDTAALRALGGLEKDAALPAVPALTKLLTAQGDVRYDRFEVAAALLRMDSENAASLAYFHEFLGPSAKPGRMYDVADALEEIGAAGAKLVPDLRVMLGSKNEIIREWAVEILGEIGPSAKEALPALREQLAQKTDRDKRRLERAIQRIEGR